MRTWLLIGFLMLSACSATTPGGAPSVGIIGGQVVTAQDAVARSTGLLLIYNAQTQDAFICSSVLVSKDVVLSAAHCFFDENTGRPRGASFTKFLIFGNTFDVQSNDSFKNAYVISEKSYVVHPKYSNRTLANDIAVIRLNKALLPGLLPVKVLKNLKSVRDVTVAGFGLTSATNAPPRISQLKLLKTVISPAKDPDAPIAVAVKTSALQRPAIGDSGGPAFSGLYVWGLDSHALKSLDQEFYTPIGPYLDFVRSSAQKLGSPFSIQAD